MQTLGKRLKMFRGGVGITKTELSIRSQLSRACISEIESDTHSNVTVFTLCSLCKALNVTPNDLIPKEYYSNRE